MANIQPYINAINQAVLGEEVRDAIVNALTAINNELVLGSENGDPQELALQVIDNTAARHTHDNQSLLDKLGENENGLMTYDGNVVGAS